jgi:hypothetical protein
VATTPEKIIAATRSALPGTAIDMSGDSIRFKTLAGNTVFTISNPLLDRVVVVELDGVFTVALPGTVDVVNGDYLPNLGKNYLYLHCVDAVAPAYVGTWSTGV